MKSIYIYGASGHGLVVSDIAKACGYDNVIFIDDGDNKYPSFEDIKKTNDIPIALGIGNNTIRAKLFNKVKLNNFEIKTLIHPSCIISPSTKIGLGVVVMPNVVVNVNSIVGAGVILNTSCLIEHDCYISNFAHISPKVALAGNVSVGISTHIGIGSSVIQGINIGDNCIIGSSSNVVKNIDSNNKAYGNPCKIIKGIQR